LKKWVLIGLALLVAVLIVAGVRFFATTPGKIDRSQNKIEPISAEHHSGSAGAAVDA
jgi:membrane dipeptidase